MRRSAISRPRPNPSRPTENKKKLSTHSQYDPRLYPTHWQLRRHPWPSEPQHGECKETGVDERGRSITPPRAPVYKREILAPPLWLNHTDQLLEPRTYRLYRPWITALWTYLSVVSPAANSYCFSSATSVTSRSFSVVFIALWTRPFNSTTGHEHAIIDSVFHTLTNNIRPASQVANGWSPFRLSAQLRKKTVSRQFLNCFETVLLQFLRRIWWLLLYVCIVV